MPVIFSILSIESIVGGQNLLVAVVYCPIQAGIAVYLLSRLLSWSAFVGLAAMLASTPVPGFVLRLSQTVQKDLSSAVSLTDSRLQAVHELI